MLAPLIPLICVTAAAGPVAAGTCTLATPFVEVKLQGGLPVVITNRLTGQVLVSGGGAPASDVVALFGPAGLRLADARVRERTGPEGTFTRYEWPDGSAWVVQWSGDASGDLIVRASGRSRNPVRQFRFPLAGCNIRDMKLVTVTNFGVGLVREAPWDEPVADPAEDEYFPQYVQPLVASSRDRVAASSWRGAAWRSARRT